MKRELTFQEIEGIIEMEDRCGVNNLLQEIFSTSEGCEFQLGKHYKVLCEINDKGQLGEYEVIKLGEQNEKV
jgi:hypothetical protein